MTSHSEAVDYADFIAGKMQSAPSVGIAECDIPGEMFPHQADLARWALRKGRAAVFADTGLGKTMIELVWAANVAKRGRVLILAPLAVGKQIEREAERFGIAAAYRRGDEGEAITIANYEMLHAFDPGNFVGIVLDESSILKSFGGRTRTELIEAFRGTPYRLACTATPAPNDFTELGNHSEFLGVQTRSEMLAEYFVHDGGSVQNWRLKGHAVQPFWRWLASWGAVLRKPSDLGHDDTRYALPPLRMRTHIVEVAADAARSAGLLFAMDTITLQEQRATRRATIGARVDVIARLAECGDPVLVWCELNDEADAIEAAIPCAVQVAGRDDRDTKEDRLAAFASGEIRVLVTKPSVAGFGMNWQHCSRMIFAGASHSYEATYQAIRRCWRFGQTRPVDVHIVCAETDRQIIANYKRKEADAERMAAAMIESVLPSVRAEVVGQTKRWVDYDPQHAMVVPEWVGMDGAL